MNKKTKRAEAAPTLEQLEQEARVANERFGIAVKADMQARGTTERDLLTWEARKAEAELWGAVDKYSRKIHDLLVGNEEHPAALKVKARSATGFVVVYDDGMSFHSTRRLGGLETRPIYMEWDHSDPARPGTITEIIHRKTETHDR